MTGAAYQRVIDALAATGCRVDEKSGGRANAQAPGHSPADRSISIAPADKYAGIVMHSHADDLDTVLDALGLTLSDLYDVPRGTGPRPVPAPPTPEQLERRAKRAELDAAHRTEHERDLDDAARVAAQSLLGDHAADPALVGAVARRLAEAPDPAADPPADKAEGPKRSVAAQLVDRATSLYRLGMSDDEEPYGVSTGLPHVAMLLRGGRTGLRAELARSYFADTGQVAAQQALADAVNVLEGMAAQQDPTRLFLRVAEHNGAVHIDAGDLGGHVITISGGRWEISRTAPVVFARTKLTAMMPDPVPGADLAELWEFVPIAEPDRPVLLACLVQALIQVDVPHPVVALLAEQGSAKSSTTRMLVDLIDPSPVPLRQAPRDADSWVTAAAGSWVVALDNLSGLPAWLSDSLCRASTGDGNVKRALYSDAGLAVVKFRRVVIVNGIDLGAIRGDLGERLALVDLPRISKDKRRNETELNLAWSDAKGRIFGALLDLAARVHLILPGVKLDEAPRMADFAHVLAAVDQALGTDGFTRYTERAERIAEDSLSADDFIARLRSERYSADGQTATEVLAGVRATLAEGDRPGRDWPKNGRAVTTLLRRHAPALRSIGWTVADDGGRNKRKSLQWTVTPPEKAGNSSSPHPPNPPTVADQQEQGRKVAGQVAGQTNDGNSPNPPAGHGGSDENARPASNPPLFSTKTAGQPGSAGQAGQAGVNYSSAPLPTPGGVTSSTPGQTDRVAAALARAASTTPTDCPHCDRPLVYADDIADGFHTSNSACTRAERKKTA